METRHETKRVCDCPLCYMVWTTYDKYKNCKQKIKNKIYNKLNKSSKYEIESSN
jgi:hypothetical protein